jgi:hypothetical protein
LAHGREEGRRKERKGFLLGREYLSAMSLDALYKCVSILISKVQSTPCAETRFRA